MWNLLKDPLFLGDVIMHLSREVVVQIQDNVHFNLLVSKMVINEIPYLITTQPLKSLNWPVAILLATYFFFP